MFHTRVRQEGALKADNSHILRKALRGGMSKSFVKRCCQLLATNAHKMAPRTSQGLQERAWDAPTKGLEWVHLIAYNHTSFILQIEYVLFNLFVVLVVHTSFYTTCYFGEPQGTFLEVPRPGFGSFFLDLVSFFKDRHRVASWVFMTNLL